MPAQPRPTTPRTYFLNERQQLRALEKKGFGALPKLGVIDWARRGRAINTSLGKVRAAMAASKDPLREKRLFVIAQPVASLPKFKETKGKKVNFSEKIDFRTKEFAQVFGRLGLNLVDVTSQGSAIVHASPERFAELVTASEYLPQAGLRERARWSTIDSFGVVPASERLDLAWTQTLQAHQAVDIIFEAQPLLTRAEADLVLRAVSGYRKDGQERLTGTGSDYSGRQWARGMMLPATLRQVANDLSSLQSIHPPLFAIAASRASQPGIERRERGVTPAPRRLPTVALLDNGVPTGHVLLAGFARAGQVAPSGATPGVFGDHGSQVASRIVFGEVTDPDHLPAPECNFLDVRVSDDEGTIDSKVVMDALAAVVAAFPDVRVFNLSINRDKPFEHLDTESKKEWFRIVREIDNFAYDNDRAVIVAAGNTSENEIPAPAYPNHAQDGRWGMGFWSCGFNSLVCGSYVGHPTAGGLGDPEWPSPFTRTGPGVCGCPVPGFGAPGGNMDTHHRTAPGMGELVSDANGDWVESYGTSLAAPLLAREVAKTLDALAARCPPGVRPFTCTSKAYLVLTAEERSVPKHVKELAALTIGRGRASNSRLLHPLAATAVLVWQGIISRSDEKLRIVVPIPKTWLNAATSPHCRLVICWETPVNDANSEVWACRKVEAQLKPGMADDLDAARGSNSPHRTYPVIDRHYDLKKALKGVAPAGDAWLLEVSYTELGMAEYYLGVAPDPSQKVGLAAELYDNADAPVAPHQFMQALPIIELLDRLSILNAAIRTPVSVPT
jgi:hypothetical protein